MTTTRTPRSEVNTSWNGRQKPTIFEAPLQDAYRIVHDEDNRVIYILSNSGKEIPATFWKARNPI